jgi:hypothetical protein
LESGLTWILIPASLFHSILQGEAQLMGEVGWTSNLIQSVNFMSFIWNDNMREKRE